MPRLHLSRMSLTRLGIAMAVTLGLIIWLVTQRFMLGALAALITVSGLGLNLDNVVVVGPLLRMLPPWGQRLFFSLGLLVSVVGVQLFVPVLIVSKAVGMPLGDTIHLAVYHSDLFSLLQADTAQFIDAGAASFLCLMAITYMFDPQKELHWWRWAEEKMAELGEQTFLGFGIVGGALLILSFFAPTDHREWLAFTCFSCYVLFAFFHMAGRYIEESSRKQAASTKKPGWGRAVIGLSFFLFLEGLFSIDSLASAFAITTQIVPIVAGVVSSSLFMRALLIETTESDRLSQFKYLETAAYWAVGFLGIVTYLKAFEVQVPEYIAGLGGTAIIVWGALHSHLENQKTVKETVAGQQETTPVP